MNFKSLLLAVSTTLLVALSSCQKNDSKGGDAPLPEGTTYMSISIRNIVPEMSRLKATTEDQSFNSVGDWTGRDAIKQVKVYIIDNNNGTIETKVVSPRTGATHSVVINDNKVSPLEAWTTTPGDKTIYALINGLNTEYERLLDAATPANFAQEYTKVVSMTATDKVDPSYGSLDNGKDVIVMTGAPTIINVQRGVTKQQAEGGANTAKIEVRRALAQAVVTQQSGQTFNIEVDGKVIATLTDLTWTGAQYEKTSKGYEKNTTVATIQTPSYDFIPSETVAYTQAQGKYVYNRTIDKPVKSFDRTTGNTAQNIMPQLLGNGFAEDNSIYLTETTHKMGGPLAIDGGDASNETGYRKGNTPYFIVKAKIKPADTAWAQGEVSGSTTRAIELRQNVQQNDPLLQGDIHYFGGKFYKSLDKAKAAAGTQDITSNNAKDKVITYKDGYCYYIYWYNPQEMEIGGVMKPVNSPIVRNNLYHVNITGFVKLGLTGNPLDPDPENPNKPDPDDPNTPDPNEPLYNTDTFMTCEINIVPWGVHSFDHKFN